MNQSTNQASKAPNDARQPAEQPILSSQPNPRVRQLAKRANQTTKSQPTSRVKQPTHPNYPRSKKQPKQSQNLPVKSQQSNSNQVNLLNNKSTKHPSQGFTSDHNPPLSLTPHLHEHRLDRGLSLRPSFAFYPPPNPDLAKPVPAPLLLHNLLPNHAHKLYKQPVGASSGGGGGGPIPCRNNDEAFGGGGRGSGPPYHA